MKTNIKVKPVYSARSSSAVANQYRLEFADGEALQSYDSIVASRLYRNSELDNIRLGSDWDYSKTTVKYVCQFLGMTKKEIDKAVKRGSIMVYDNEEALFQIKEEVSA